MSLKKVRGGMTGFGDTLVSKTCHFLMVSRKGRREGSLYLVFYGIHCLILLMSTNLTQRHNMSMFVY